MLYAVSQNYEGMLTEQRRFLDELGDLLKKRAGSVASKASRKRLEDMAAFYITVRDAMDGALKQWRAKKDRA